MEMRGVLRVVRSQPASSLLFKPPMLYNPVFLRYSSTTAPGSPTVKPSQRSSASSSSTSTSAPPKRAPTSSDFDDILDKLDINSRQSAQTSQAGGPGGKPGKKAGSSPLSSSNQPVFSDPLSLSRAVSQGVETEQYYRSSSLRRVELTLGPKLGRQVNVEPERGLDLPSALRRLQIQCSANRIKQQVREQKYHVRRGQKLKNLKVERWRRLFRQSFQRTVTKIQRMRAQGW
ncbi:hypothetical protein ASPZODRAFT_66131 [Penicilliopsis zonata CBS 506.65]|uniref:Ribosomal protein S21 n=1 Tax=Penicilliopsis zonata CBS 506.65 TaxID=1073090 RepID=A0A1L9SHK3_9EURO|nr:hypothetical protein ASPZODRAFT_66131 [Penicilliopsis zonata CBS 506.65]OJJ46607.1 hypothetical protein ASPZODRAFT_66131 [Penicilliopsis zonata CBS 506.65]